MKTLFGVIGLILGGSIDEVSGAIFGGAIGVLTGIVILYRDRIIALEKNVHQLLSAIPEKDNEQTEEPVPEQEPDTVDTALASQTEEVVERIEEPVQQVAREFDPVNYDQHTDEWTASPSEDSEPTLIEQGFNYIKNFFTSGNVVVKVAIIILFFGISFLIKYAAEKNMFPIELRLIGIALFGIALLLIGWRLRIKNALYALVLQGGGIGVLYLTVFAAGRYQLLPMPMVFAILFLLVICSCLLAIKQNAQSLAIFATVGGFLAPILTSTGQGSHISLFSYYAVLNAGIFAIAWFKSWRSLNWLGFMFTFVIASIWGARYYQPDYFNSTEPFLILFFLFYVAISILFAFRQPPKLKGFVDGTLIFGTPLVGFALQSQLVNDFEYGHAWSALFMGVIYLILVKLLWNKKIEGMQTLVDSFLALGIIFLSLAIPFTLDGNWTAAAWALEGAGILWVGLRQQRLIPRMFGLLLQFAAAFIFLARNDHINPEFAIVNSIYIGSIMISIAGVFSAYQYFRHKQKLYDFEEYSSVILLFWGLLWWFGINFYEIDYHLSYRYEINASLIFSSLSFMGFAMLGQRLNWSLPEKTTVAYLPLMALFLFSIFIISGDKNPFSNFGFITWPLAFLIQYLLLFRNDQKWDATLLKIYHSITLWLLLFITTWGLVDALTEQFTNLGKWAYLLWGIIPTLVVNNLLQLTYRQQWPFKNYKVSYFSSGLLPVMVLLCLWVLAVCGERGDPSPLPYIPVLNPQDIAQLITLATVFYWVRLWQKKQIPAPIDINPLMAFSILAAIAFVWLNSVIAHSVHFYSNVNFNLSSMLRSDLFQTSMSIIWTLTAFALMGFATKKDLRQIWFIGSGLLAVVVIKLFLIDLDDSGTVTRIVSFLSVGGLMLIIGYFSPIPPKNETLKNG